MSGMNAKNGFDTTGSELPPEALAAIQALSQIQSAPTAGDETQGAANAQSAFAPLLAQLQGQQFSPSPAPEGPGNLNTFLGVLAANLANAANPEQQFGKPALDELSSLHAEQADVAKMNRTEKFAFQKRQADDGLQLAHDMTIEGLKQAQAAGDDKAAAQKAVQLARLNDSLERRRNAEEHGFKLGEIAAKTKQDKKDAGAADQTEIDAAIQDVIERGDEAFKSYSVKLRPQIGEGVRKLGYRIVPTHVRKALNEIGPAKTVVDELERAALNVTTARANSISRGIKGAKNLNDALNQTGDAAALQTAGESLIGNLSRAIGSERGVLTDQDVNRAKKMVPTIWDSEKRAREKIAMLRRFIAEKEQTAIKSFMSPTQAQAYFKESEDANGTVRVMDAQGKTGRIPAANAEAWLKAKPGRIRL